MTAIIVASIIGASFVIGVLLLTSAIRRAVKTVDVAMARLDEIAPIFEDMPAQLEKLKDELEQGESEGEEWKN